MNCYRIISILIALNLIITSQTTYAITQEECKAKNMILDELRNTCIIDDLTVESKSKTAACSELPINEQKDCLEKLTVDVANDELKNQGLTTQGDSSNPFDPLNSDETDFKVRALPLQIMTGMITYYLLERKFNNKEICQSPSLFTMLGAGVAAAMGEIISSYYYYDELNEIHDEYIKFTDDKCETINDVDDILASRIRTSIINASKIKQPLPAPTPTTNPVGVNFPTRTLQEAKAIIGQSEVDRITAQETSKIQEDSEINRCSTDSKEFKDLDDSQISDINSRQIRTFELLEKQERARATAAKIKGGAYAVATLAYLTATGLAIFETAKPGDYCPDLNKKAKGAKKPSAFLNTEVSHIIAQMQQINIEIEFENFNKENDFFVDFKDLTTDEIQEITLRSIVKTAGEEVLKYAMPIVYADDEKFVVEQNFYTKKDTTGGGQALAAFTVLLGQMGVGAAISPIVDLYSYILETAPGRTIAAGSVATMSGFVSYYAFDEAETSSQRADAIKKIKNNFAATGGAKFEACPDRNDPSKPTCFCYLSSGEKNFKRLSSQTCLNEWDETGPLKPVNYRITSQSSKGPKKCITNGGKLDDKCACRSAKRNADKCVTVQGDVNFNGVASSSFAKGSIEQVNAITNGVLAPGDVEVGNNLNNAINFKRKLDQAQKSSPTLKKNAAKINKIKDQFRKANNIIGQKIEKIAASLPSNTGTNVSNISSPKDALKALKDNLKKESTLKFAPAKGNSDVAKEENGYDDFNFGMENEASPGVSVEDLDSAMNKDYDFKGDINNNPDNNLFEILTLRYKRSALRRLFDDEGKLSAQESSGTDINE